MTGKGEYFPGLIPLVQAYLHHINCNDVAFEGITKSLDFIEKQATGKLMTPATWLRDHSVVSQENVYDLTVACNDIGKGTRHEPDLHGDIHINPITTDGAYDVKLSCKKG